jgi:hypothetical protein
MQRMHKAHAAALAQSKAQEPVADERDGLAQKARDFAMALRFDRDCPQCSAVFPDDETKRAADFLETLAAALAQQAVRQEPVGWLIHSRNGSQFVFGAYRPTLRGYSVVSGTEPITHETPLYTSTVEQHRENQREMLERGIESMRKNASDSGMDLS